MSEEFFHWVSHLEHDIWVFFPKITSLLFFVVVVVVSLYLDVLFLSQKRLEQKADIAATPTGTTATPAATPKVIVGSISGQGTPPTKVVLSTKMGTPITFQQNKNFQQSFATWVKQGQSTQGIISTSISASFIL